MSDLNTKKEIAKNISAYVLYSIFELAMPFFEADKKYSISAKKLRQELNNSKIDVNQKIARLKKNGYISTFVKNKENYLEISAKGMKKIRIYSIMNSIEKRPKNWDRKWRVIIFDVPDKHKSERDCFRRKLSEIGFEKIQESVYVYPFECTEMVTNLSGYFNIKNYVLIMLSEIIQGEEKIIEDFIDKNILSKEDITQKR